MAINFDNVDQLTLTSVVRNLDDAALAQASTDLTRANATTVEMSEENEQSLAAAIKNVQKELRRRVKVENTEAVEADAAVLEAYGMDENEIIPEDEPDVAETAAILADPEAMAAIAEGEADLRNEPVSA